ncbi:unnamed protein product [Rotaria sordida]|uniref:FAD-binding PCMH-type domain-containing protein n=1 Tax=Rotaria sordida TaxID=392033 RepID=A0A813TRP6_9BILA|nr:unnamed protein product [Rotaria sordida]CAF3645030.1 unnamed protein product [Rotaria sordida]
MTSTTASYRANSKLARTNNDDLQTCLSSSLPLSIHTIYPCSTLANQNSSQYQCDHFNVNGLSSVRGGRISHFPAVIVYATDSNDVQNVVKCATKLNYIVNARSGGHSYEGYSLGSMYNNIVINMEAINYIRINQYDGTGTFGAGARIGPIYYRTYQYNYTINTGSCAWIGLAGHALGGGLGELITINKTHEPELYWALRGSGGGLFVIVTEFKIRLVKAPPLARRFSSIWYPNATKLVMQRYQSLLFDDKISNFSNNLVLAMGVSKTHVEISILYFGIEFDEFNKTVSLLLATLPTPNRTDLYEQDWLTFVYKSSGIDDDTKHLFYDGPISSHSLDKFIDRLASGDGQINMGFNSWDGYLSTIPADETAFPHRHFKFDIQFTVYPNDEQHEQQ